MLMEQNECTFQPNVHTTSKFNAHLADGMSVEQRNKIWELNWQKKIKEKQLKFEDKDIVECTF